MKYLIITSLLMLFSTSALCQKIYKWTDANGVTHYSSQPHENAAEFRVGTAVPEPATEPSAAATPEQPAAEPEPAPAADEQPTYSEREIRAEERRVCEQARRNVATIESRPRIRESGPDGEIRYLSDEERQAKLDQSQTLVDKYCK